MATNKNKKNKKHNKNVLKQQKTPRKKHVFYISSCKPDCQCMKDITLLERQIIVGILLRWLSVCTWNINQCKGQWLKSAVKHC